MFKKTEIGKILLIAGILFLIDPLLQVLNFYHWYGLLVTLSFGWLLTILSAILISPRVSAWTFLFMGFYLYFFYFETLENFPGSDIDRFVGPLISFIVVLHILLGLILGIISFLKAKKDKAVL